MRAVRCVGVRAVEVRRHCLGFCGYQDQGSVPSTSETMEVRFVPRTNTQSYIVLLPSRRKITFLSVDDLLRTEVIH